MVSPALSTPRSAVDVAVDPVDPTPDAAGLDALEATLDAGRAFLAWRDAVAISDPRGWRGARGRVLAGRLGYHAGSVRLGVVLPTLARREHPHDLAAVVMESRLGIGRRGPWRVWHDLAARAEELAAAPPRLAADAFALRALCAALLRDFETAHSLLAEAAARSEEPWIDVERARVLEMEDRFDAAADAVDAALARRPWYHAAVEIRARFLRAQGRDDAALALLYEATHHTESGPLWKQLAALQGDLELWADAAETVETAARVVPLLAVDRAGRSWLDGVRGELAYQRGDRAGAVAAWERHPSKALRDLAARLATDGAGEDAGRRSLPVPWVRQHHRTCSPATLGALCRYWSHPAEHLEIAESICYDGTPAHAQRRWAERGGFVVRVFTVDEPTTRALVERGVPFTLVTVGVAEAHLQAVVGFDARRGSVLCRDPAVEYLVELAAEPLFAALRSSGPRGMLFLPPAEAARLDGLELPETALYDLHDAVESALAEHDREAAEVAYRELTARAPGHRLALLARRALAAYDGDARKQLDCVERLLVLYPDDQGFRLARCGLERDLLPLRDRLAALVRETARPAADALFALALAETFSADARRHPDARRLLRGVLRRRPTQPEAHGALARLEWAGEDRRQALELFRFAACLGDLDEGANAAYFQAAFVLGQGAAALSFLRRRFERLRDRSGAPAATLATALEAIGRVDEGLAVLDQALEHRPADGELLLHAAVAQAGAGDLPGAWRRVEAAGAVAAASRERARAHLAEIGGDPAAALAAWRRVAALAPASFEVHAAIARLAAAVEEPSRALAHLREVCARHPHDVRLAELRVQWLRAEAPGEAEGALRGLLEADPTSAWAHRELALVLAEAGQVDAAAAAVALAEELEPWSAAFFGVRGFVQERAGDGNAALASYRRAFALAPDETWALSRLFDVARPVAERRSELPRVAAELSRGVTGEAVPFFASVARRLLEAAEADRLLDALHAERPDLFATWAVRVERHLDRLRHDDAVALALEATERFPLRAQAWRLLAWAQAAAGRPVEEESALRRALALDPSLGPARVRLVDLLLELGRDGEAREAAAEGVARDPRDARCLRAHAEALWRHGETGAALEALVRAVELQPGDREGWESLVARAHAEGVPDRAEAAARRQVERRPDDAASWSCLALAAVALEDALAAADRALALAPRDVDLHLQKVGLLVHARRLDDAVIACRPAVFGDDRPTELVGEEAAVRAQAGDLAAAVATMRPAVEADPNYLFGWSRLADWLLDLDRPAEARQAATRWAELAPGAATAWALRGEGAALTGDLAAAVADLDRALELDPGYVYAGLRRADLAEQAGDTAAALETLGRVATAARHPRVLRRCLELACRTDRHDRTARWIHHLASYPGDDAGEDAAAALAALGAAAPQYVATWDEASVGEEAGHLLLLARVRERIAANGRRAGWEHLRRVGAGSTAWAAVACLLLDEERALVAARPRVAWRLRRFAPELARHPESWGHVASLFLDLGQPQRVVQWMADWRSRPGVRPWMLVNLVQALRGLDADGEAYAVAGSALALPRAAADRGYPFHLLWMALWEAVEHGDLRRAKACAERPPVDLGVPAAETFLDLVRALVAAHGRCGDRDAFREARRWERRVRARPGGRFADTSRLASRVRRHVARELGGVLPRLWARLPLV